MNCINIISKLWQVPGDSPPAVLIIGSALGLKALCGESPRGCWAVGGICCCIGLADVPVNVAKGLIAVPMVLLLFK
jgi:hypothetical protein